MKKKYIIPIIHLRNVRITTILTGSPDDSPWADAKADNTNWNANTEDDMFLHGVFEDDEY